MADRDSNADDTDNVDDPQPIDLDDSIAESQPEEIRKGGNVTLTMTIEVEVSSDHPSQPSSSSPSTGTSATADDHGSDPLQLSSFEDACFRFTSPLDGQCGTTDLIGDEAKWTRNMERVDVNHESSGDASNIIVNNSVTAGYHQGESKVQDVEDRIQWLRWKYEFPGFDADEASAIALNNAPNFVAVLAHGKIRFGGVFAVDLSPFLDGDTLIVKRFSSRTNTENGESSLQQCGTSHNDDDLDKALCLYPGTLCFDSFYNYMKTK